ncbi:MAG: hypothetical protein AB7V00_02080 [Bacilli bacterium]
MDEREKILQMLKDGIISIPEAMTLLDAITDRSEEPNKENKKFISEETKEKLRVQIREYNDQLESFGENINERVKEIIKKVENKLNDKKEKNHE